MLNKYQTFIVPVLKNQYNYYNGKQAILYKQYEDETKPCSHVVTNFCKNIVDIYTGYIAAPNCINYQSDSDIEQILEVLKYNDVATEDVDFLRTALICGTSNELMYIDEEKKVRFTVVSPLCSFGIYSDDLTNDLLYFVRWVKEEDWVNDSQNYLLDVYGPKTVKHYRMLGMNGPLEFLGEEIHYFNQCPANTFSLENEEGIFKCIMSLQDAYNETLSNQGDEISSLANSYMVLTGAFDAESIDVTQMRQNRLICLPEGATTEWLIKDVNDNQTNTNLDRIQENIYRISCCPDFSSDSFSSGVSSGVAIKYRLTGCETRASTVEAAMKKALQRRIELICGFAAILTGEEVFRDIKINFTRNLPEDYSTAANLVSTLKGMVSDETLIAQFDFIDDPKEEVEKVKKQNEEQMKLYSFGGDTVSTTGKED